MLWAAYPGGATVGTVLESSLGQPGACSSTLGMGRPPAELHLGFVAEQSHHCAPVGSQGAGRDLSSHVQGGDRSPELKWETKLHDSIGASLSPWLWGSPENVLSPLLEYFLPECDCYKLGEAFKNKASYYKEGVIG